jgi:hypothetical protein
MVSQSYKKDYLMQIYLTESSRSCFRDIVTFYRGLKYNKEEYYSIVTLRGSLFALKVGKYISSILAGLI